MQNTDKKLSRPSKEAERAAALRDNLKKRKAATAQRDNKDDGNDAEPDHSPSV